VFSRIYCCSIYRVAIGFLINGIALYQRSLGIPEKVNGDSGGKPNGIPE
jgi:hypothetical protein